MTTRLLFLAAALSLPAAAAAGPLQRPDIDANAKWMAHLDLDQLRSTQLGRHLAARFLGAPWEGLRTYAGLDAEFKPDHVLSLTAYGTDFSSKKLGADAVLIIHAAENGCQLLRNFAEGKAQNQSQTEVAIKRLNSDSMALFEMNGEVLIGFAGKDRLLVGKSRGALEAAQAVLNRSRPSLASTNTFEDYPAATRGFFFLGVAEGFNEHAEVPPQAKVFQSAEGVQAILGEADSSRLFLNATLKTKTAEASTQIQQVTQGMLALLLLSQSENPDLRQLLQSAKLSAAGRAVSLSVEFPVDQALRRLDENTGGDERRKSGDAEPDKKPKTDAPAPGSRL